MKKIISVLALALSATGVVFAQNRGDVQIITVEGTLQLRNGLIAVVNGDSFYYVPVLERYIGFINGLKEDAQVSLEGYAMRNNFIANKLTISGKNYAINNTHAQPRMVLYNDDRHGAVRRTMRYDGGNTVRHKMIYDNTDSGIPGSCYCQ